MSDAAKRTTVFLVGLDDKSAEELSSGWPPGLAAERLDAGQWQSPAASARAAEALGYFVQCSKANEALKGVAERQALWQLHGIGLCVLNADLAPAALSFATYFGAEEVGATADLTGKGKRIVERWARREERYRAVLARLMKDIEGALAAADYDKGRQLIDSLILIDPRRRFYLPLLAIKMREERRLDRAEECLKRTLIHWPKNAAALAQLTELAVRADDAPAAAELGKRLVAALGLSAVEALLGAPGLTADQVLAGLPETARLLGRLYGAPAVTQFARAYLEAAEKTGDEAEQTLFSGVLRQSAGAAILSELGPLVKGAPSPAAPAPVKAAPPPKPAAAQPAGAPCDLLEMPPPDRAYTDSKLLELIEAKIATPAEFEIDQSGTGNEILYRGRVFVYHPEVSGYMRLAKVFNGIGYEIAGGHHDLTTASDYLRSVRVSLLVLWYQEGQESALALLRDVLESRDLAPFPIWVLSPSQSAQIQFATKAQGLLFDSNDIVRWQRGQFADDFKRMMARATAADSPVQALGRLRRSWWEPLVPPLGGREVAELVQPLAPALAKEPARGYWFKAEELLHAAARGDAQGALPAADKLRASLPEAFDAQLVAATVRARAGDAAGAGDAFAAWLTAAAAPPAERCLRAARAMAGWRAATALQKLASFAMKLPELSATAQAHAVAALYYQGGNRGKEAAAHLVKACVTTPARPDYWMALADTFDRKSASRAADLWALAARRAVAPAWYCNLRAGEVLAAGENYLRAQAMLEQAIQDSPERQETQRLLAEVKKHLTAG